MSTAVFSRAPSQPGAEAEHPNPRGASGAPSGGVPQGGHVPGQDPGLAHPHLMTRPMFYIHAQPPPPFLQYQWPMPFYNPFNPFSGLGYGMMMPPFPPAPYMEPPTYFIPHAPLQPMDYRRTVHPQAHPQTHPSTTPYPNQARRPRPPNGSLVRETVNSGVQTEPREGEFQGGSPLRSCADSGRGTAPSSPTSSTSSNQKNSNGDGENCSQAKGLQLRIACTRSGIKPGLQTSNPGERHSIQKMAKEKCLVNLPSLKSRSTHLVRQENVETVETVDTVDTPNKEMSLKERRVSVPDILMSWGNGTPKEDGIATDKSEKLPSYEDEATNIQSSTVVNENLLDTDLVDGDKGENEQVVDPKLCYDPCEHSLNISIKVCSVGHDTVNEPTLEELSENAQTASGKSRRKLNESIWSVESLPVYIPTKEWLAQNTTMGPEVILEMAEEVENGPPSDETMNQRRQHNSSTDSVQMSDSFIGFSTPASKGAAEQASNTTNEPLIYKLQKHMNLPDSPICDKSKSADTEIERKEMAEPTSSPKRQSLPVEEKLEKSGDCNKEKTCLLETEKGDGEESSQKKGPQVGVELLPLPIHAVLEVSPSKVDCGVQFPEPQTNKGNAGMNVKQCNKAIDVHNPSTRSEGYYGYGQKRRHYQYRSKGPDKAYGQQEAFFQPFDRQGKSRGGKGRH